MFRPGVPGVLNAHAVAVPTVAPAAFLNVTEYVYAVFDVEIVYIVAA